MTDTIKRLAGPALPSKLLAGAAVYTPGASTKAAVKNAVVANTHGSRTGWITLGIGDLSVAANRFASGIAVPPRGQIVIPLDVIVDNALGDVVRASQQMAQDPSALIVANKVNDPDTTNATSYATPSWAATNNSSVYLMTVIHTLAGSAPAAPNSFTDTHSGFTWTALQNISNGAAGTNGEFIRIDQYIAQSTGTTNTTTTVGFAATQSGCSIIIDEIQGADTSGSNGDAAFLALGTTELIGTLTSMSFGSDVAGLRFAAFVHGANEVTNPGVSMTELADAAYATPNTGSESAYTFSPYVDLSATWTTTATRRLAAAVGCVDTVKGLTVTLNGVEVT